jgi:xylulokinase
VVVAGGGDNATSAVGVGAVAPGDAFISLGTSGVIFVVNDALQADPTLAYMLSAMRSPDAGTR